jgi:hypothetical protein
MPAGTSDSPFTNKTEFQRFLDDRPTELKSLGKRLREYQIVKKQKNEFGFWLRTKHREEFNALYNDWWKGHPEFFDAEAPQDLLPIK